MQHRLGVLKQNFKVMARKPCLHSGSNEEICNPLAEFLLPIIREGTYACNPLETLSPVTLDKS